MKQKKVAEMEKENSGDSSYYSNCRGTPQENVDFYAGIRITFSETNSEF